MGVILRLAMATTEKMVIRQARTVHLRFSKTRMYSPRADSCESNSGYTRGLIDLPKSSPAGCISRTDGLLACTSGPESMHSPQQVFKTPFGARRPGWQPCPQKARRLDGWFIAWELSHNG